MADDALDVVLEGVTVEPGLDMLVILDVVATDDRDDDVELLLARTLEDWLVDETVELAAEYIGGETPRTETRTAASVPVSDTSP